MSTEGYFTPEYQASRRKVVKELRQIAETPLPEPQADWGLIWVLSGPKTKLKTENSSSWYGEHQETGQRFKTGISIAREVTARRLKKNLEDITIDDIKKHGPKIYFNGLESENEQLKGFMGSSENFETEYNFPISNIIITDSTAIKHTGHQFEDFAQDLPDKERLVIISDLYHLPRVARYVKKHSDKFSDTPILYPSQPQNLPVRAALTEIKKIHPYTKTGILPPETVEQNNDSEV